MGSNALLDKGMLASFLTPGVKKHPRSLFTITLANMDPFLPRDACSAVLLSQVVRPSVRPSLRL